MDAKTLSAYFWLVNANIWLAAAVISPNNRTFSAVVAVGSFALAGWRLR